jgi:hypothetical protein
MEHKLRPTVPTQHKQKQQMSSPLSTELPTLTSGSDMSILYMTAVSS